MRKPKKIKARRVDDQITIGHNAHIKRTGDLWTRTLPRRPTKNALLAWQIQKALQED